MKRVTVKLIITLSLCLQSTIAYCPLCQEVRTGQLNILCSHGAISNDDITSNCTTNLWQITKLKVLHKNESNTTRGTINITENGFVNFTNLQEISLSSMSLISLPPSIFFSLKYLRTIDLSVNTFSTLPTNLFKSQLGTLTFLNLSHNSLSFLPPNFLSEFITLMSIDLSFNKLSSLPSKEPIHWPISFKLFSHNNPLPPCWAVNQSHVVQNTSWWCSNYSTVANGTFQEMVEMPCTSGMYPSTHGIVLWHSPNKHLYSYGNGTKWRLVFTTHFLPSVIHVSSIADNSSLFIDNMRPYFNGVWTCLIITSNGNKTVVNVIKQILLLCRSKVLETYHWSLIVSAICTVAMVVIGVLSTFLRHIWVTRCFTRKVHVVSALSLHDLQYSPRLYEQRIKILCKYEDRGRMAASVDTSIGSSFDYGAHPNSALPSWLPPHLKRSIDLFAHGGYAATATDASEASSMFDGQPAPYFSSNESLGINYDDEEGDTMDVDEHGLRSRVDEFRERLRSNMVKRVDTVRCRMRESRHSMEESTSRVMKTLRSGSSVAASKMRSGLYNSVESVKFQVRTVTEFCGGGSVSLGQTVSVATLDTDLDTQETTERRIVDVTAV